MSAVGWQTEAPPRRAFERGSSTQPVVPAWMPVALLLVCVFAPYGLVPGGGGTLRLDHLAIPSCLLFCLWTGRLVSPGPLGVGLWLFILVAFVSSVFSADIFAAQPLSAIKNLDGLMRGPAVLVIAASVRVDAIGVRRLTRTLAGIMVVLAVFALVERSFPLDSALNQKLISLYGGPVADIGLYAATGMNHKSLMILSGRACAVFPTAPALGMVSVFVLLVSVLPGLGLSDRARALAGAAAVLAGLLSTSKSFMFGIPVALVLAFLSGGSWMTYLGLGAAASAGAATLYFSGGPDALLRNPFMNAAGPGDAPGLGQLTGGRVGGEGLTMFSVFRDVVNDAPLLGYGLGTREGVIYSDSGLNRLVLHGGLLGLLVVTVGVAAQAAWFWKQRDVHPWARFGLALLFVALAFFMAGAVFLMPRVNDVLFTLLGTSIAVTRHQAARDRIAAGARAT